MDNKYALEHIYQYFKVNIKTYILSFFVSILIVGALFMYSSATSKQQVESQSEEERSVVFSFILENEQGNLMNNAGALNQILLTTLSEQKFFSKAAEDGFKVTYEDATNSFQVFFANEVDKSLVSKTKDYLVLQIEQNKINFFNNKDIYFIDEQVSNENGTTSVSKKNLILYIGLIIMLTIIIGTVIANFVEAKKEKISHKFYLANNIMVLDVHSLKLQTKEERIETIKSIINGNLNNKIIVKENNISVLRDLLINDKKAVVLSDLGKLETRLPIDPEEIVIICEKDESSKIWYNRQVELAKNSVNIVKVIYI